MATITARPLSQTSAEVAGKPASGDALLRFAMRADGTLCAGVGLFVAIAADPMARLSGLSPAAEFLAGALLVGYGVALYLLAATPDLRRFGSAVVGANLGFAAVAVTVVVAGWLPLTGFGIGTTLAFVALTLALAYLQVHGLRRLV